MNRRFRNLRRRGRPYIFIDIGQPFQLFLSSVVSYAARNAGPVMKLAGQARNEIGYFRVAKSSQAIVGAGRR